MSNKFLRKETVPEPESHFNLAATPPPQSTPNIKGLSKFLMAGIKFGSISTSTNTTGLAQSAKVIPELLITDNLNDAVHTIKETEENKESYNDHQAIVDPVEDEWQQTLKEIERDDPALLSDLRLSSIDMWTFLDSLL